jgi:hypothetical protein
MATQPDATHALRETLLFDWPEWNTANGHALHAPPRCLTPKEKSNEAAAPGLFGGLVVRGGLL